MPKDKKENSLIIQKEAIIILIKTSNDFYKFKCPLIKSMFNFTINNIIKFLICFRNTTKTFSL